MSTGSATMDLLSPSVVPVWALLNTANHLIRAPTGRTPLSCLDFIQTAHVEALSSRIDVHGSHASRLLVPRILEDLLLMNTGRRIAMERAHELQTQR